MRHRYFVGLLFIIFLTMISGAWKKEGYTYALASSERGEETPKNHANCAIVAARRRCLLEPLGLELLQYAMKREGKFPAKSDVDVSSADLWKLPRPFPSNDVYLNDRSMGEEKTSLAFEPDVFDGEPWVYYTDGTMRRLPTPELLRQLKGVAP